MLPRRRRAEGQVSCVTIVSKSIRENVIGREALISPCRAPKKALKGEMFALFRVERLEPASRRALHMQRGAMIMIRASLATHLPCKMRVWCGARDAPA